MLENLRNIAIIAHVDHGKTTLVDKPLQQSGTLDHQRKARNGSWTPMIWNGERGITIRQEHCDPLERLPHQHRGYPGSRRLRRRVERVLSMVDSVLLLVDAVDGPMPQTRFVTRRRSPRVEAHRGHQQDRPSGARPDWANGSGIRSVRQPRCTDEQLTSRLFTPLH